MELIHSVGHISLQPESKPCFFVGPLSDEPEDLISEPNLLTICEILVWVQRESQLGFTDRSPPPWLPNSLFMTLRQSLEATRLTLPEILPPNGSDLRLAFTNGGPAAENYLTNLTWHLSVIFVNHIFLPIPVANSSGNPDSTQKQPPNGSVDTIRYPNAPMLFLKGRTTACEESAAGIARSCRELMSHGVLYLVGRSLVLSVT